MRFRGIALAAAVGLFTIAPAFAQQADMPPNESEAQGLLDEGADESSTLPRSAIQDVQRCLQQLGLLRQGKVDGIWNQETVQATENFQKAHHIEPTGQPDALTLAAMGVQFGAEQVSGTNEANLGLAGTSQGMGAPPNGSQRALPGMKAAQVQDLGGASHQSAAIRQIGGTAR